MALVHADPRCPDLTKAAVDVATASGAFLVGGLVSHRCETPLVARSPGEDGLGANGIAGVMLAPEIAVATSLTQGCMPIGPAHRIDEARDNIVDGRSMAVRRSACFSRISGRIWRRTCGASAG